MKTEIGAILAGLALSGFGVASGGATEIIDNGSGSGTGGDSGSTGTHHHCGTIGGAGCASVQCAAVECGVGCTTTACGADCAVTACNYYGCSWDGCYTGCNY